MQSYYDQIITIRGLFRTSRSGDQLLCCQRKIYGRILYAPRNCTKARMVGSLGRKPGCFLLLRDEWESRLNPVIRD